MTILKGFDIDSIRRDRARKLAGSGVDLVAALAQISPEIAKLNVGDTARIEIPNYKNVDKEGRPVELRKFVMSITAKLNYLTPQGGDWAGRQFKVISDSERYVYVQRGEDLKGNKIPVRSRRGGRPAGSGTNTSNASSNADTGSGNESTTVENDTLVTEHA